MSGFKWISTVLLAVTGLMLFPVSNQAQQNHLHYADDRFAAALDRELSSIRQIGPDTEADLAERILDLLENHHYDGLSYEELDYECQASVRQTLEQIVDAALDQTVEAQNHQPVNGIILAATTNSTKSGSGKQRGRCRRGARDHRHPRGQILTLTTMSGRAQWGPSRPVTRLPQSDDLCRMKPSAIRPPPINSTLFGSGVVDSKATESA